MTDWPFDPLTPMKYGAILADPPWAYIMRSEKGHAKSPESHYATMTLDDIKALPVGHLAGPGCYLFLWSTWPHLDSAFEVLRAWDFIYVTGGSWTKRTRHGKVAFGTGYVLRSATEPYIIGRIARPERKSRSERNLIEAAEIAELPDGIDSQRREHSRKPPEMRQMIERLVPKACCVELFAREAWPGHEVWGNEAGKFGSVA